jgi:methionine-rich copper-binding protein CopC
MTLGVLLGAQAPAGAHNSLVDSSPNNGAVLDRAPAEVQLKFLASLDPVTTKITLNDPAGASAAAAAARFNGSTVIQPLRPTTAGLYTIGYEVASGDGHPIRGKVTFTLTAAAVPAPSPSPSPSRSVATAPAPPDGTLAGNTESTPWWPWAVAGALVLAAIGTGSAIMAHRRRSSTRPIRRPTTPSPR